MLESLNKWAAVGALLLAFAVAAGAFGAHVLKHRLPAEDLAIYEKAVWYQTVHALGMLLAAALALQGALAASSARLIELLLLAGIVLFSGSLYALVGTGLPWLGAITPLGGTAYIAAWLWLALSLWKGR